MVRGKIREGCYNVRITVDEDGRPEVGFIHRLYRNGEGRAWKSAPESTRKAIEAALTPACEE